METPRRAAESTRHASSWTPRTRPTGSCSADGCLSIPSRTGRDGQGAGQPGWTRTEPRMEFIRYRVTDEDRTFLDEFSSNAPDFAKERIDRIRKYHPNLTVTETPDND